MIYSLIISLYNHFFQIDIGILKYFSIMKKYFDPRNDLSRGILTDIFFPVLSWEINCLPMFDQSTPYNGNSSGEIHYRNLLFLSGICLKIDWLIIYLSCTS